MHATSPHKTSLCVLIVFAINLINQLECRSNGLINERSAGYPNSNSNPNLRKPDATVADATQPSQQIANNEQLRVLEHKLSGLSPEARQATVNSLNRYFLVYNLLKSAPLKRSPGAYPPDPLRSGLNSQLPLSSASSSFQPRSSPSSFSSNSENSLFRPAKRRFDFTRLAFTPGFMGPAKKAAGSRQENKVSQPNSNQSTPFLEIVRDWKKEQPTCSQLKSLWEAAINKLTDHFLHDNNDLYMQPHLNQMDNPIYLALLINLMRKEPNEQLKVFDFKPQPKAGLSQLKEKSSPNNIVNHGKSPNDRTNDRPNDRPNNQPLNKAVEQSKPLSMDYLMNLLNPNKPKDSNESPYYFKNFKLLDKESAAKFIPNPIDRQDHSLEIIEDGPTFIYGVDSDSSPSQFSAAQFWGDAQLSRPVHKPEARYWSGFRTFGNILFDIWCESRFTRSRHQKRIPTNSSSSFPKRSLKLD